MVKILLVLLRKQAMLVVDVSGDEGSGQTGGRGVYSIYWTRHYRKVGSQNKSASFQEWIKWNKPFLEYEALWY